MTKRVKHCSMKYVITVWVLVIVCYGLNAVILIHYEASMRYPNEMNIHGRKLRISTETCLKPAPGFIKKQLLARNMSYNTTKNHLTNQNNSSNSSNSNTFSIFTSILHAELYRKKFIDIAYPKYNFKLPHFLYESDLRLFLSHAETREHLQTIKGEYFRGHIRLYEHAKASMYHECSWRSKINSLDSVAGVFNSQIVTHTLTIPLLINHVGSFQNFISGVLPKLVQVSQIIKDYPQIKILLSKDTKGRMIPEMLEEMGISSSNVIHIRVGTYASPQINTCITPPMHPIMWRYARKLLNIPHNTITQNINLMDYYFTPTGGKVILLTRTKSHKRKILNEVDVRDFLYRVYGDRVIVVDGVWSLDDTKKMFSDAGLIIGVSGGALYNMLFAPYNTTVIEIMPFLNANGQLCSGVSPTQFWLMADTLGHQYWRMYERTVNGHNDVILNIRKLACILDAI